VKDSLGKEVLMVLGCGSKKKNERKKENVISHRQPLGEVLHPREKKKSMQTLQDGPPGDAGPRRKKSRTGMHGFSQDCFKTKETLGEMETGEDLAQTHSKRPINKDKREGEQKVCF